MIEAQPRRVWSLLGPLVFVGAGVLLVFVVSQYGTINVAPTPTHTALAVGSTIVTPATEMFWVDQAGLAAWDRAVANHDNRGMDSAMTVYETFWTDAPAQARITARSGNNTQIELLAGPAAGRRGWTHAFWARTPS